MERITAYKSTDGQLFNDKKECQAHQKDLNKRIALNEIALEIDNNPNYYSDDAGFSLIAADNFADFVIANEAAIRSALDGKILAAAVSAPEATQVVAAQ